MRIDNDFKMFCAHTEWYEVVKGVGYVPTESCPEHARKAMERVNENNKKSRKKAKQ